MIGIILDVIRRMAWLAFGVSLVAAHAQPLKTLTDLAENLSIGNAAGALKAFDREMPDYQRIAAAINALTAQADIYCSIDILSDEGDETHRAADLDWFVQLRSKAEDGPLERRRERVQVRLEKRGKSWKITSFQPLTILSELKAVSRAPGGARGSFAIPNF